MIDDDQESFAWKWFHTYPAVISVGMIQNIVQNIVQTQFNHL